MNRPLLLATLVLTTAMLACNLGTSVPTADGNQPAQDDSVMEAPTMASTGAAPAAPNACDNPYLPVIAGATWNYNLTGPENDTFTRSILAVNADGFTEQDVFGVGVTRQGEWKCKNGSLVALNPSGGGSASIEAEGVKVDFQTTKLEGMTLPASINPGDSWSQSLTLEGAQTINGTAYPASNQLTSTCTAVGIESITVIAGAFDAMRIDCQTILNLTMDMGGAPIQNTLNLSASNWYAIKVGLIKTITTGSGLDSVVELTSYSIPQP
ncbi:MAG: hypothetical protein HXY38_14320 [Chloroflexi bacterium]|nr:hypothetical protein [Chloroflexota bacterium]